MPPHPGSTGPITGARATTRQRRPAHGFIRTVLSRILSVTDHIFDRNTRGLDGVLLDLEYQRMELIRFNLFDNATYRQYAEGREENGTRVAGSLLKTWPEMRLAETHPEFAKLKIEANGNQLCDGELIRSRTQTGHMQRHSQSCDGVFRAIVSPATAHLNRLSRALKKMCWLPTVTAAGFRCSNGSPGDQP